MAVATAPRRVVSRAWRWKWRIVAVVVVVGLTGLALTLNRARSQPTVPAVATPVVRPITAQASLVPVRQTSLTFQSAGIVKEVRVKAGDKVKAGDVLATLDTTDLDLKLQEAQANLAIQKATAAQVTEKASDADIAAARMALDSAIAKQKEVEAGASPADLKAAQEAVVSAKASLDNAQAQYNKVLQGPSQSDVAAAEANVKTAESQVATAQQNLNDLKAKPKPEDVATAQLALDQAKNQLWSAQTSRDGTCGAAGSDSVACKSANATVAAQETAVQSAQAALEIAKKPATADQIAAAEKALQSAQAGLSSAQAALARVKAGPTAADREAAKAQVDQAASSLRTAQAKLAQLQAGPTAADKAAAQSAVDQARASLEKLTNGVSPATLDLNQARIHQAEIQVAAAEQALKEAELIAPFDGVVTSVNVTPGQPSVASAGSTAGASASASAITVADLSSLHFETSDLDEVSAAKVAVGDPVKVTIPALDKQTFDGSVTEVSLEPTVTASGNVNYTVKITLKESPPGLRWGQTARVEFLPKK